MLRKAQFVRGNHTGVHTSLDPSSNENHDFFSGSGSSYVIVARMKILSSVIYTLCIGFALYLLSEYAQLVLPVGYFF